MSLAVLVMGLMLLKPTAVQYIGMAVVVGEMSTGRNLMRLLNAGSGQRPFLAPWLNLDKQAVWNPDIICDFGNPLDPAPFVDGSVDVIVSHHNLEHYGCGEADEMLKYCHRLLGPRGYLLVFVPDMWELTAMWREGHLSDQVFFTNVYGAYMGHEADRHKWGFTRFSLTETLYNAGFKRVRPFDWRDVYGADLAKDRWVLAMEASK